MPSAIVDVPAFVAAVAEIDPALLTGADAARAAEDLARAAKVCTAAASRLASRAAECNAHRQRGFADAADWVARTTGSTRRDAQAALETAAAVESYGATRDALAAGDVSLAQAREIVRTEAECPGTEGELLAVARRSNLSTVKDEARRRRLAGVDRDELHARQRAARSGRHWIDAAGMVCASIALPPVEGTAFVNRWDTETDRLWRAAQRAGDGVTRDQAAADAFVELAASGGGGSRGRSRAEVVVVVDLPALRRGRTNGDERCHVIGGGPIPVGVARELAEGDAFIKAVVYDGRDITTVRHLGRHVPAELRTALLLGPLPAMEGARCCVEGCERRYGLELDHERPVAANGETSWCNLKWRCTPDHAEKSRNERAAGLYDPDAWDDARPPP